MPKPTQNELYGVLCSHGWRGNVEAARVADQLNVFWSTRWDAEEEACRRFAGEDEQMERFNEAQRIRREAYEAALKDQGHAVRQERARAAADRYPLRKRAAKLIPDPHIAGGLWSSEGRFLMWHGARNAPPSAVGPAYTPERVRALAALLSDPWEYVEDRTVEEVSDG